MLVVLRFRLRRHLLLFPALIYRIRLLLFSCFLLFLRLQKQLLAGLESRHNVSPRTFINLSIELVDKRALESELGNKPRLGVSELRQNQVNVGRL